MGALVDGLSPERRGDLIFIDDSKLQFRETSNYIQSESSGKITVVSGSTDADAIKLDSKTTIDDNTVVNGTTTLTGNATINGDAEINLSSKDGSTGLVIKDSETFPVNSLLSNGNIKTKGNVVKQ